MPEKPAKQWSYMTVQVDGKSEQVRTVNGKGRADGGSLVHMNLKGILEENAKRNWEIDHMLLSGLNEAGDFVILIVFKQQITAQSLPPGRS